MMKSMKNTVAPTAVLMVVFYLALLIWWASINTKGLVDTTQNFYYGVSLGILAILGGISGIFVSKDWGMFSSKIGKALIFISTGFITWGIGTLVIGYYNIAQGQSYPYPSLADVAYIISWPLWLFGMINLSKATGARYQLKNATGKLLAFIIVVIAILLSYYLLFQVARGGEFAIDKESYLRLFFDFAYPVGDIVILTSALLLVGLSFNYLGGMLKTPILLILTGFVINYIADIIFTYTNTIGTFYVAGWVDLVYTTAFFLLGLGVSLFDQRRLSVLRND